MGSTNAVLCAGIGKGFAAATTGGTGFCTGWTAGWTTATGFATIALAGGAGTDGAVIAGLIAGLIAGVGSIVCDGVVLGSAACVVDDRSMFVAVGEPLVMA